MNIFAQVMGVFAIITWVMSIILKNKKDIILSQVVANAIYSVEYTILKADSAASMNFLSFIRLIIYYIFARKNKELPKIILIVFSFLVIVLGIFTYNGLLSIIPIIITLFYTYSLWQDNLKITRIIYVVSAFIWIYYNFQVGAFVGIIGNMLEIIAGIGALIKYHK